MFLKKRLFIDVSIVTKYVFVHYYRRNTVRMKGFVVERN